MMGLLFCYYIEMSKIIIFFLIKRNYIMKIYMFVVFFMWWEDKYGNFFYFESILKFVKLSFLSEMKCYLRYRFFVLYNIVSFEIKIWI